jgi:hypothetical protein
MFARTACRTRVSESCLKLGREQTFNRWANAVDDRTKVSRLLLPRLLEFFQRGKHSFSLRVTQHHDERCGEPFSSKFDAADLKGRDDISGNANDEEITQALVEDDLCRYSRVRASQNDGEWLLAFCEFTPPRLSVE